MSYRLKPIADQVIVITGASSGIGLATATRAANAGASVVLAARNGPELEQIVNRIVSQGGKAAHVVADVSKREDVQRIADEAVKAFGRFDTWVNNAGVGIWGRLDQVSDDDHRRLFEVNFWGLVYGSQIAAAYLKNSRGGAIINLGSVVSDVTMPIQGMYSASKHAIKGFTDAFRMELKEQHAPISITLIKPSAINTPFAQHARNYLDEEPVLPPPIYQPEDVAAAIVHAAEHGGRDYYIGAGGKLMSSLNKHVPSLVDQLLSRMTGLESKGAPRRDPEGALHKHGDDGLTRGKPAYLARRSLYTYLQVNPGILAATAAATVAGVALALLTGGRREPLRRTRRRFI